MERSIILIGMPGCGKSTVGKKLAEKTSLPMYDTDSIIEQDSGISIPEIFSTRGETYFRELETEALKKALSFPPGIIACGGGIVLKDENRELLKKGFTVFLERPLDKLVKKGRPLSETRDLSDLYSERIGFYKECADLTVENNFLDDTAKKILNAKK